MANGAKPYEVEGLAKTVVGRLMSLAEGGQTLLGRSAFDTARRDSVGTNAMPPKIIWLAHGSYEMPGNSEDFEVGWQSGTMVTREIVPTSNVR